MLPNAVGYLNKEANQGFGVKSPAFATVGQETFDLKDVVPYSPSTEDLDGLVYLMIIDEQGGSGYTYTWGYDDEETFGWRDMGGAYITSVPFKVGTAFWVQIDDYSDVVLKFAGEVVTKELEMGINQGFGTVGNPYAASVKLMDVKPYSPSTEDLDGLVYLMKIDAQGGSGYTYTWGYDDEETFGWRDMGGAYIDDKIEVIAGEAFWVQVDDYADVILKWPGLDL